MMRSVPRSFTSAKRLSVGIMAPCIRTVAGELELGDRIGEVAIWGHLEGEDFAATIARGDKAPLGMVEHDLDHALFKIRHSDGVDKFEIPGWFDTEGAE